MRIKLGTVLIRGIFAIALLGFIGSVVPAWTRSQEPSSSDPPAGQFPGANLVNSLPPFLVNVRVDRPSGVYREGETFRAEFQVERESLVYLLYHQADRSTLLLFPNVARPGNRVAAGEKVGIPDRGQPFRFRIRPPFGVEVLQVLAASQPIEELASIDIKQQRAPRVTPKILEKIRQRLAAEPSSWSEHRVPMRTIAVDARPPTQPASRVGLFIGIGKYRDDKLAPPHEELRHSAEVMHELMVKHGGLDPARTKLIVDQQATKANIQQLSFRWLPSVSQPGDTVFIYFSGHAGQFDNLDGTEPDGQDESLGPYDLDAGTAKMSVEARLARYRDSSILDDTLARWLEELQGRQIVLILDTCHAGGVVEGKGLGKFFADEAARVKDIAQLNTVILTSTASDEQALFEGTPNKTMWFTYFLAEAMTTLDRPVTVQAAYPYTQKKMREIVVKLGEARVQNPTLTDNAILPIVLVP